MSETKTTKTSRYELLIKLIDMTVSRSRGSLNVEQIVQETYGDDVSAYGGQEMLEGIVDNMLEKWEETVKERMHQHLENNGVKERLREIDDIIHRVQEQAYQEEQNEIDDIDSARQALNDALLPADVELESLMCYVAYQKKLEQKEQLTKALQEVENDIALLQKHREEAETKVRENAQTLQQVAQTLEKSADVCSMVTTAS